MFESVITSKGRTTLPKGIRDAVALQPGDKVRYAVHRGGVWLQKAKPAGELRGFLRYDGPPLSQEDMRRGVIEGATRHFSAPEKPQTYEQALERLQEMEEAADAQGRRLRALEAENRKLRSQTRPTAAARPRVSSEGGLSNSPQSDESVRPVRWPFAAKPAVLGGRHNALMRQAAQAAHWPSNFTCGLGDWRAFLDRLNLALAPPLASTGAEGRELDRLALFALRAAGKAAQSFDHEAFSMRQRARSVARRPLNDEQERTLIAGYEAGSSIADLADIAGVSSESVRWILRRRGVPLTGRARRAERSHQRTRERDVRLVAGRAAGRSLRELAADEGMTAEGVRLVLKRMRGDVRE